MKKSLYHKPGMLLSLTILIMATSCKKYVQVGAPTNQVPTAQAFQNNTTAISSILGLYSNSNLVPANGSLENSFVGSITALGGMSADDIYYIAGTYLDAFKNNSIPSGLGYVNNPWNYAYSEIYYCNSALEGLTAASAITDTLKQQLLGEAYFLRAFTYFYLTNLYGDVPLVTTTSVSTNSSMPRTAQAEVYKTIVSDLKQAQNLLATGYPSTLRARANKAVATAMLARVYLYQKDYADAETQATAVIGNSTYKIETPDNAFLNTSNEVIWQVSTYYGYSIFGYDFVPSTTTPNYVLYPSMAASFEAGDLRATKWMKAIAVGSSTYYYPYKYKLRTSTAGNEYDVMIRLAELYLIRAEARAQQNNLTGTGSAAEDLNVVRARAGLTGTPATSQSDLLLAVENERAHELFSEMGHRWFDLKRTGRADAVLAPLKPSYTSTSVLWPVPLSQITSNPSLTQNLGY